MAAVIIIAFALFVYKMRKGRVRRNYELKAVSEIRSTVEAIPISAETYSTAGPSLFTPRDPRLAVRHHYRRFLKLCAERGCPPEKGDTSGEINAKNKAKFPEDSIMRLRELYIKARYSEHPIASKDSKEAGELVRGL
jgi:hypothetical protein